MTNGERIRQMTDEELAELRVIGMRFCTIPNCEEHHGNCKNCILEWLKEESDGQDERRDQA